MKNLGRWYWKSQKYTKLCEKTGFEYPDFQNYPERLKIITVSNIERKCEPFREIKKIKCFLKQVKLVTNITSNGIKLMKIIKVTMMSLKYVEKIEGLDRNWK